MFTVLVPLVLLLKWQDPNARTWAFFAALCLLAVLVFVRLTVLSPVFPHDRYRTYTGPDHSDHAPVPGQTKWPR